MSKLKKEIEVSKPEYSAQGSYSWKETDEIVFTGAEFGVLNQIVSGFINGTSMGINQYVMAYNILQSKMKEYYDKGVIHVLEPEETANTKVN